MEILQHMPGNGEVDDYLELSQESRHALSRLAEFVALHKSGRGGMIGDRSRLVEIPSEDTERYVKMINEIREDFKKSSEVQTFFLPLYSEKIDGKVYCSRYIGSIDSISERHGILIGEGMTINENSEHVRTVYAELAEQQSIEDHKAAAASRAAENGS